MPHNKNPIFFCPPQLAPGGDLDPSRDINFVLSSIFSNIVPFTLLDNPICPVIILSRPPIEAYDVPTVPARPPIEAYDITTTPAGPPIAAYDVPTPLSSPPADPVDVPLVPSSPAAEGPEASPGPPRHANNINDETGSDDPLPEERADQTRDHRVADPLIHPSHPPAVEPDHLAQRAARQEEVAQGGNLDPFKDINRIAHLKDGTIGQILDAIDFVGDRLSLRNPFENHKKAIEVGIQMGTLGLKGLIMDMAAISVSEFNERIEVYLGGNVYGPSRPFVSETKASIKDDIKNDISRRKARAQGIFTKDRVNLENLNPNGSRDPLNSFQALARATVVQDPLQHATEFAPSGLGKPSAAPTGQIKMSFPGEETDGTVITRPGEFPHDSKHVPDDAAYVPLSFTDLRPLNGAGSLRTIYFRPFITSLTEDKSVEYNKQTLFGRADQVVTYMSTVRTVFIGFDLHAFFPEDLELIYKKLNWLDSMVYPEYDANMLLKAGPACRMRIGDVISSRNKRGLSGVIDSLSYDFTDSIWEVADGKRAPRSVKVNLSFHVLHDLPIGRGINGQFGGIIPSQGPQSVSVLNQAATTGQGSLTDELTTVSPTAYRGIGDPRKKGLLDK